MELFEKQLKEALEQDIASGLDNDNLYNQYAHETGLDKREANVCRLKDVKTWKILIEHGIKPKCKDHNRSAWLQNLYERYNTLPPAHKEAAFDLLDAMFDPDEEKQSMLPFEGKAASLYLEKLHYMYEEDNIEKKRLPVSQVKPSRAKKLARNIVRGWFKNGDITTHFNRNGEFANPHVSTQTKEFAEDVYKHVMSDRTMRALLIRKQKIEDDPTRPDRADELQELRKINFKKAHDRWHEIKGKVM